MVNIHLQHDPNEMNSYCTLFSKNMHSVFVAFSMEPLWDRRHKL